MSNIKTLANTSASESATGKRRKTETGARRRKGRQECTDGGLQNKNKQGKYMSEKNWNEFQAFDNEVKYMAPKMSREQTKQAMRRAKGILGRAALLAMR